MSNYVHINSKFDAYYVTDEAYAQILALVQAHKLCNYNGQHPYDEENPCVGNNICLEHFLQRHRFLTYVGQWENYRDDYYQGKRAYRFVDAQGYIYVSVEDMTKEVSRSTGDTLSYYGFTPPEKVVSRGKSVDFYPHYATLHGDLKTASVIVASYNEHSQKVKAVFLLYKNGSSKELSKKSDLYRNAEALVEASKDEHGQYRLNGQVYDYKYEGHLFEIVSQLESAMYDVTLKLKNGSTHTDERTSGGEENGKESLRQESEA